jgi:hypothetical protein
MNPDKIIHRVELFKKYIREDAHVKYYLGKNIKKVFAYMDLYLALHLAMAKKKSESVKILFRSISSHPFICFNIRFWSVVKKLLISL